ncbi:MAG: DUF1592 domain-containing protein [Polyangiaceae bacterium]|nr:DUF1592 domain-containing protein [Polyangiaceae bacterium]
MVISKIVRRRCNKIATSAQVPLSVALSGLLSVSCAAEVSNPRPGGAAVGSPGPNSSSGGNTSNPVAVPSGSVGGPVGSVPANLGTCAPGAAIAPLRRITAGQYAASVQDLFRGKIAPSVQFPSSTTTISPSGFSTDPESNAVTQLAAEGILKAAEDTAVDVGTKLTELLPCAATAPDQACAGQFLDDYGTRAFRRALTADERSNLLAVFSGFSADGFNVGIAAMTEAMLQLPQFLYLIEMGTADAPTGAIQLTPDEVATRLSFLLWGSLPDDALRTAARSGGLSSPMGVRSEALRLLSDARANGAVQRFFREWTSFKHLAASSRTALDPTFSDALDASMQAQFDQFASDSVFGADPSLEHLFTSNSVPVDAELAKFYGVAAPSGAGFSAVSLDATHAAGLLGLPALLGGLSHETVTSIVFRGKFGLTKLLCTDLPSPPAGAASQSPVLPADATTRQKSEALRANPTCAACHNLIDNVGLGFEDFDAVGRYRTVDALGRPVDARGQLPNGKVFNGVAELGTLLATDPVVGQCLAKQWFRFTFSRRESDADSCTLSALEGALALPGRSLKELMLAVVSQPAFSARLVRDTATGGAP